jgi:hypothetical protein
MRKLLKSIICVSLILLCVSKVKLEAAAINSTATGGLHNLGASWTGGVVPGVGDTATVIAGSTITYAGGTWILGTGVVNNDALTIEGNFTIPYDCPSSTIILHGDCEIIDGNYGTFRIASDANHYLSSNTVRIYSSRTGTAVPKLTLHQSTNAGRFYAYGSIYMNDVATTTTKTITSNFAHTTSSQVTCSVDIDAKPDQQYMIAGTHGVSDTEILTVANYDRLTKTITFSSNFTKVHSTGAPIGLLSHNLIFGTTNVGTSMYWNKEANATLERQNVLYWDNVEFRGMGGSGDAFYGQGTAITVKNSSFYNNGGIYVYSGNGAIFENCIFAKNNASSVYLFATDTQGSGVVVTDSYFFSVTGGRAPIYDLGANNTYRNCWFGGASAQAFYQNGCFNTVIENSSFTCIATNIFYLTATNGSVNTKNCYYVQLSTNVSDANTPNSVFAQNATYREMTYSDSGSIWYSTNASTPSASSGFFTRDFDYTSGSIWKCQNFNGITDNNRFYTGSYMVLRDTQTVRTAGSPSLNLAVGAYPAYLWNTNPAYVSFPIPINSGESYVVQGYLRKNSTYGSSNLPAIKAVLSYDLSTEYSSAMTDTNDTWVYVTLGGIATATGVLDVKLYAYNQLKTVGANCWADDVRAWVGNSVYSCGKVWSGGYPQISPIATTVDASNLWGASTSGYSAGTMGYNVGTNLDGKISDISISTTPIVNAVWGKTIYSTKSASETLREIRRREP